MNPQWNSWLRGANLLGWIRFVVVVQSHSCECLKPGCNKGGASPTVAFVNKNVQRRWAKFIVYGYDG